MATYNNPFKKAGFPDKKNFNPKSMDHLVVVDKVDAAAGIIYGKNHLGVQAKYKIAPEIIAKRSGFKKVEDGKFSGHTINDAAIFDAGTYLVMEKAKWVSNDEDGKSYVTTWVHQGNVSSPDKIFPAIMTARGNKEGKITVINVWDNKSINCSDKDAVSALAERIETVFKTKIEDRNTPSIGFQLRALKSGVDQDGKVCMVCFDSSAPIDQVRVNGEEENRATFSPITKASFVESCNNYASKLKERHPTFTADNSQIEILVFTTHIASKYSKSFEISEKFKFDPKLKMISRVSKRYPDDADGYTGSNVAVKGIFVFTEDKFDMKTKTLTKMNIANKIYVNNTLYDARSIIDSSLGLRVITDPSIAVVIKDPVEVKTLADVVGEAKTPTALAKMAKAHAEMAGWEDDADPFL